MEHIKQTHMYEDQKIEVSYDTRLEDTETHRWATINNTSHRGTMAFAVRRYSEKRPKRRHRTVTFGKKFKLAS